jgi:hypothetical protein
MTPQGVSSKKERSNMVDEKPHHGSTPLTTPKQPPSSASTTIQSPAALQRENNSDSIIPVVPLQDAVDDPFHEDHYAYSDDSGSLSDAYFFPQHDSTNALISDMDSDYDRQQSALYGSFERSQSPPLQHLHHPERLRSSSSLNGTTILEDAPVTQSTPLVSAMRPHDRIRKQNRHRNRLRKVQEQRERAVTQVRGKPQPLTTHHDSFWLFLFVLQLLYVFACAIRYGCTLIQIHPTPLFQESNVWDSYSSTSTNRPAQIVVIPGLDNRSFATPGNRTLGKNATSLPALAFNTTTYKNTPKDLKPLQDDDSFQLEKPKKPPSSNIPSITFTATAPPSPLKTATQESSQYAPFSIDYQNIIKLFVISGIYACVTSYLSFGFMLIVARSLIPIMLVFTILLALCWGIFGLTVFQYGIVSILGFSFLILALGYALVCWNRIPFCSTNLYTAICAMKSTTGILLVGIGSLWVALLWCLIWIIAVMGIFNKNNSVDCQLRSNCETRVVLESDWSVELAILIFSFYWTNMVIKNVVRVTVASAIGGWWFAAPREDHRCCDHTVWDPLIRSCTNSLGSICLGSLLVFPAQTISVLGRCCCWVTGAGRYHDSLVATPTKKSENEGDCEHEHALDQQCGGIVNRLARRLRCCNRWSFTYIGMYGYTFAQGGEKAIQLFETREWMDIVRDNLIQNILFMASIVIGGSAGLFSVLVEEADGYSFTSLNQPIMTAFWIGSILGFVLSNILLLGVVGSAVNTILVCFAADPFEFDRNHPRLSREMREVWSQQVWEPAEESV